MWSRGGLRALSSAVQLHREDGGALFCEPGQRPAPPRLSACSPSPVTLPPAPRAADEIEKQARAPDNASRKSSAAARRESTGTRSRGVYRCDERSP